MIHMDKSPVIFFDGQCNLCNGFVDFVLNHDLGANYKFGSLQGKSAQKLLGPNKDITTIILWERGEVFTKSTAILKIFVSLGGFWKIFGFLQFVPRPFRDYFYEKVAQYRYRIFGQRDTCRVPNEYEKNRFLD